MRKVYLFFLLIIISFSCENEEKWTDLLNENDLKGWHYYNDNGNKTGWSVENGILSFDPSLAKFKRDQDGKIINDDDGNPKKITVAIWPEGGFTDVEKTMAIDNGYSVIQSGPRLMRTETASIMALSILQYLYGDLSI